MNICKEEVKPFPKVIDQVEEEKYISENNLTYHVSNSVRTNSCLKFNFIFK